MISLDQNFRVCPVTKFKVNRASEMLVKINAVVAVVALLIGVIAAIGLVLTRWQAIHLLPAEMYYRFLTLHGLNMLIYFIIFFEMAVLYFAGTVPLNARLPAPWIGWVAFVLMVTGAVMTDTMVLQGKADVLFTSYVPLRADPMYYLGIILFAVGALIVTFHFFACIVVAKKEKTYEGSLPLVSFGALTAAIIAVVTLIHGAIVYVPTFFWSLGMMQVDPEVYRMIWWALGHSSQQINVAAMVAIWYMLGGLTVGAVVLNEKISRMAFFLYILFISMASAHHLLVDPGMGSAWKVWNTSYAMYLAVLASLIHGFTVPGGIEMGQRLRGFNNGKFEWIRKAPWGDPGFSALIISVLIFGFMGGITGVIIGTEQINIIVHNTLRVPGHFHTTVVGGTALAFMGATYYLLPLVFRKKVAFWKLAKIQPYLFGAGNVIFSLSMSSLGIFGVPRRHWDISFSQAPFKVEFNPAIDVLQATMGIGGLMMASAVLIFIAIAVVSVFFGKKFTEADIRPGVEGVPQGIIKLPIQDHGPESDAIAHKLGAPGTMTFVMIFLTVFVLYYFVNWKMLASVWKVG